MIIHKEKLIGRIAIISCVKDAIVTYKGLEIEPVLGMTLNPAVPKISILERGQYGYDSLDRVATPAGARCD